MRKTLAAFTALFVCGLAHAGAAATPSLPAALRIEYRLTTNGMAIGTSIRTLQRNADGTFSHQLHTVPQGFARTFTKTEWFEEGRFRVRDEAVEPLYYEKFRQGGKAHRHSATFDWDKSLLTYKDGRQDTLKSGVMDGASVFFGLMLRPPAEGASGNFLLTNGKRLVPYEYRFLRAEKLPTALGELPTLVVEWRSMDESDDDRPHFTAWMSQDRYHVPLRVVAKEGRRTAIMDIRTLSIDAPESANAASSRASRAPAE
jgi:hypothetical protein